MRVAGEVVGLKEAILCLNTLAEQARLDPNLRNRDVIVKTWNRILDFAAERSDPERILAKWTPFYTYLE
ncbi:MAG: hypothetical protein GWM98_30055, partial [Nitrospinaceae bacterium]|nr:hypothetical protein [Nitrospinaceae bacterium]NIR57933.1 hypothetical protein [Nitrospinaceae bacterium]NIS88393.1 hypothetical protein [Nitrospinaceae bacterium]NIT85269.1 hypothetical protein [Nitrospinaceae bacterium]NIU47424.1 hypothetical protein [Nitrospinaceae bacterium]